MKPTFTLRNLLIYLCLITYGCSFGQNPADLDLSFNYLNGRFPSLSGTTSEYGSGTINTMVVQQDGKILLAGEFINYQNNLANRIVRINQDGSYDATFNAAGSYYGGGINAVIVQPDGKILVCGMISPNSDNRVKHIVRLNADGTTDTTFNTGTGANSSILGMALQPDGKVIIGGWFTSYNGNLCNRIARLNANGTLDTNFNPGTGAGVNVSGVRLLSNGKIAVIGSFSTFNNVSRPRIAMLNSNGSLDTSYNPRTDIEHISAMEVQQDDKIIISTSPYTTHQTLITRLNLDGSIDTTFNPDAGTDNTISSITQLDNKIIITGYFTSCSGVAREKIAVLNADGSLEESFNVTNVINGSVRTLLPMPGNKLLVAGDFTQYGNINRGNIARLNTDGSLDDNFEPRTGGGGLIKGLSNGKLLIGNTYYYNGVLMHGIARLNNNGSIDSSFNAGSGISNTTTGSQPDIGHILVQPDDKILIAGKFDMYQGINRRNIARLNADGSLDESFVADIPELAYNDYIQAMVLQPDGKSLVGINHITDGGAGTIYYSSITRLNADGSRDNSFNFENLSVRSLKKIIVQADGEILVLTNCVVYALDPDCEVIVRLNTDGSIDNGLNTAAAVRSGRDIVLQPDGKVLLLGDLNNSWGSTLARLNQDGTLDTTFYMGLTVGYGNSIVLQQDGKILIAAEYFYIGDNFSESYRGIARANADGTLDVGFDSREGTFPSGTNSIVLQPDGKIVITGAFMSYNGIMRSYIARLYGNFVPCTTGLPQGENYQTVTVTPGSVITLQDLEVTGTEIRWYNAQGEFVNTDTPIIDGDLQYATQTVNGCESEMLPVVVNMVLNIDSVIKTKLTYYPNPVKDNLNISSAGIIENVAVYALTGQKIVNSVINATNAAVDLSQLKQGTYVVHVYSGGAFKSFVVIKN